MVPKSPTAMNWLPSQVTAKSRVSVPEFPSVQVTPSGDVRTCPVLSTPTALKGDHATSFTSSVTPVFWRIQVTPSGEVSIAPPWPAATPNGLPAGGGTATVTRLAWVPDMCGNQLAPSGEVTMVPPKPTPMNCWPSQPIPSSALGAPEGWAIQPAPSGERRTLEVEASETKKTAPDHAIPCSAPVVCESWAAQLTLS